MAHPEVAVGRLAAREVRNGVIALVVGLVVMVSAVVKSFTYDVARQRRRSRRPPRQPGRSGAVRDALRRDDAGRVRGVAGRNVHLRDRRPVGRDGVDPGVAR